MEHLDVRNRMIGANIKYFRIAKGHTVRSLASVIGIPSSSLSAYEQGNSTVSIKTLDIIAKILGITIDILTRANITEMLNFIVDYVDLNQPDTLGPLLFWLSKSLHGSLKESALQQALTRIDPSDIQYPKICFELGSIYEKKDQMKSIHYYKIAANGSFVS